MDNLIESRTNEDTDEKKACAAEKDEESLSDQGNNSKIDDKDQPQPSNDEGNPKTVDINLRALPKDAATYKLETFEKNALLIFNLKNIKGVKPRYGTEKDANALENTFKKLGFDVEVKTDPTKKEIFVELNAFSSQNFTNHGCVGVAVLTHGSSRGLLHAKDEWFNESDVIDHFKVHEKPTLVSKPRFFIIQACRGEIKVPAAPVAFASKMDDKLDASLEPYILPAEADMLILHSTFMGRLSYRNTVEGSWFIKALCQKIDQLASTHDIESIMTEVKRDVAFEKEACDPDGDGDDFFIYKQMPVMTSTLIRKLYLKKFGDPSPMIRVADRYKCHSCYSRGDRQTNKQPEPSGPCSCVLGYFEYLKNCFRIYLEENSSDEVARSHLELAKTFGNSEQFNATKASMVKIMCKHLTNRAAQSQCYKYFYIV